MNCKLAYRMASFWLARVVVSPIAALLLFSATAFAIAPKESSPDFSLPAQTGNRVKLSDFRGKVVYLDFWASWCGPCRHTLPWMNELQTKFGKQHLAVLAVNLDEHREDAEKMLLSIAPIYTVLFDPAGSVASRYALPSMPTSFVIGPDGSVISVHSGFHDGDNKSIEAELSHLLAKL